MEVVEKMNRLAGYDIKIEINPNFVRANEIKSLSGSTDKLVSMIGEIPHIDLIDTLSTMYNHKQ